MKEQYYDEILNILTNEQQKGFHPSFHYHRYEPTPYHALETLFQHYDLKPNDRIVDFGCGKGRLNFYIHYRFNATVIGIEMNETFYEQAMENREKYFKKKKTISNNIYFYRCLAEEYDIDPADNCFYFFNPFTVQIFMKVINNILISVEKSYRKIDLILYYPSEDYIYFLNSHPSFELQEEITLPEFEQNRNERFLIYRLVF